MSLPKTMSITRLPLRAALAEAGREEEGLKWLETRVREFGISASGGCNVGHVDQFAGKD